MSKKTLYDQFIEQVPEGNRHYVSLFFSSDAEKHDSVAAADIQGLRRMVEDENHLGKSIDFLRGEVHIAMIKVLTAYEEHPELKEQGKFNILPDADLELIYELIVSDPYFVRNYRIKNLLPGMPLEFIAHLRQPEDVKLAIKLNLKELNQRIVPVNGQDPLEMWLLRAGVLSKSIQLTLLQYIAKRKMESTTS